MRDYETVFVLHPSYEEKEVEAEIQALSDIIAASGGAVLEIERWGRRRLAYEIKRVHEGIYTLLRWRGSAAVPRDMERRFRLNERLLRHMTVISEGPLAPPPRLEGEAQPPRAEAVPALETTEREGGLAPEIDTASAEKADGPSQV